MKYNHYFTMIIFLLISKCEYAKAQKSDSSNLITIGIAIKHNEFDRLVKQSTEILKLSKAISSEDLVQMVRIDNTIRMNNLKGESKIYDDFTKLFKPSKFYKIIVTKLNANESKGMSFYSKKYNLYWGGAPDKNSMYNLIP